MNQDDQPTDLQETLAYRDLSTQAILGFVLALLSPVAFFAPLLLIVPFLATVLCFTAAVSINRSPERLTGSWLALSGLFLSLTLTAAIYSKNMAAESLHHRDVEALAEEFLDKLAQEDFGRACELTVDLPSRLPEGVSYKEFYGDNERAKERLDEFTSDPGVMALAGQHEIAPELVAQSAPHSHKSEVYLTRTYRVATDSRNQLVKVSFARSGRREQKPAWRVVGCKLVDSID